MTDVNFKAAAAVAALSALFLAGCSDGAKTEPPLSCRSLSCNSSGEDGNLCSALSG